MLKPVFLLALLLLAVDVPLCSLLASMEQNRQQISSSSSGSRNSGGSRHLPPGGGDRFSQSMSEKRGKNLAGMERSRLNSTFIFAMIKAIRVHMYICFSIPEAKGDIAE